MSSLVTFSVAGKTTSGRKEILTIYMMVEVIKKLITVPITEGDDSHTLDPLRIIRER